MLSSVLGAAPAAAQVLDPEMITCPRVEGYEPTFQYEERVSFNNSNGGYRVNCWYQTLDKDETGAANESELILDAYWASPAGDEYVAVWYPQGADSAAITYCSDVDEFTSGLGVTASTDVSVRVTYKFREAAKRHDAAVGKAAANALREIVAQYARSCDGVEIIPWSSYFTPLPPYIVEALAAAGEISPATPSTVVVTTATPATTSALVATTDAAAAAPPGDSAPASGSSTKRIIGFVFLGLSILGLLWTLRRAGKERKVRPRLDLVRVAVISGTAIGMMIVLANTPVWAVVGGVGLGLIVGWAQGRNVSVRFKGNAPYEKRNVIAIVAFAIGLVVSQGAGLLNRSGVIGIGVGISFFSAAIAAGILAGRRRPLGLARAAGRSHCCSAAC